jgi:hypothetical protein
VTQTYDDETDTFTFLQIAKLAPDMPMVRFAYAIHTGELCTDEHGRVLRDSFYGWWHLYRAEARAEARGVGA